MSDNMRIGSGLNHIGYLQPGTELKLPSKPPEKTPEFVAPEDQVSFRTTVPFKPEKQIKEGLNLPEEKIILPAPKEIMELPEARFTESIGADRLTGSSAFTGKGSPTTLFIDEPVSLPPGVDTGYPISLPYPNDISGSLTGAKIGGEPEKYLNGGFKMENAIAGASLGAIMGAFPESLIHEPSFWRSGFNSIESAAKEGIFTIDGDKVGK